MTIWIDANNKLWDDLGGPVGLIIGWPQGMTQATPEQIASIQNPAPTTAQVLAEYNAAIQGVLDSYAVSMQYDSMISMVSYVGDPNPTFDAQATAARSWRSAVWVSANATLSAVQAGTQPMPASVATFLATLPAHP